MNTVVDVVQQPKRNRWDHKLHKRHYGAEKTLPSLHDADGVPRTLGCDSQYVPLNADLSGSILDRYPAADDLPGDGRDRENGEEEDQGEDAAACLADSRFRITFPQWLFVCAAPVPMSNALRPLPAMQKRTGCWYDRARTLIQRGNGERA